jgi:hypothetical protein
LIIWSWLVVVGAVMALLLLVAALAALEQAQVYRLPQEIPTR